MGYENLLRPIQLGSKTAKNRIYMSPHTTGFTDGKGHVSERYISYIEERARNGVGTICAGQFLVMRNSVASACELTALDDGCVPGMSRLAEAIHRHGALALAQLNHTGRQSDGSFTRSVLFAPSAIPYAASRQMPKEMEIEDIVEVVEAFRRASRYVSAAGFDGVEVHASTGYLVEEFLSPYSNKRQDGYGGPLENRCRFLFELVDAVRTAWEGQSMILGVKLTVRQRVPGGLILEEGCEIASKLDVQKSVNFIHVSQGPYEDRDSFGRGMHTPLGELVTEAHEVKRHLSRALTIVNQRIKRPEQAERILSEGKSDLVSMARAFIADPAFVSKVQQGRAAAIRFCIGCNQECFGRLARKAPISCLQNPAVGRENEWADHQLRPVASSLRVIVIGGGPAGMKAAEIAARRGHRVLLYEAESELGGQVRLAARAPFREEVGEIISYLVVRLKELGVEINLGRRISAEEILALDPDAVIVATGSRPVPPTFPTRMHCPVHSVRDVLDGREVGPHVLLLDADGHWSGLSVAEYLVDRGNKVTFVTAMPMVAPDIPTAGDRVAAMRRLYPKGVRFVTGVSVGAVEGEDVILIHPLSAEKNRVEAVQSIVYAGNNRSDDGLYRSLKGKVSALYCIGDSAAPRRASDAIFDGQRVGASI